MSDTKPEGAANSAEEVRAMRDEWDKREPEGGADFKPDPDSFVPVEDQIALQQSGELVQEHIEHYFPKGYDPDAEPLKGIRQYHNAALERAVPKPSADLEKLADELADKGYDAANDKCDLWPELRSIALAALQRAEQLGFKRGVTFYERNQKGGEVLQRYHEPRER